MNSDTRNLWKKPKLQDLLAMFITDRLEATVENYPLEMKLEPSIPDAKELENYLELHKVYDLRFFLPLFANVLSPGSFVHCKSFMESKVLMLIFTTLSSFDVNTRSLGYYCLSQLYFHLEGANYAEKEIWLSLLDSLRNSIAFENTRLPSIITLFLARVTFIFTKPDHPLFSALYKFIMVKPNLDIGQVPEFYKLFNSIEIEHRTQRMWLLELLVKGLRSSLDFHICEKRYIFNLLLTHYWSSISTPSEKIAILKTISSAVKIETSARVLCQNSFLPWLHNVIEDVDLSNTILVKNLCILLKNLWLTSKKLLGEKISSEDTDSVSESNDTKSKSLHVSFPHEFLLVVQSLCKKLSLDFSFEKNIYENVLNRAENSVVEMCNIEVYIVKLDKYL